MRPGLASAASGASVVSLLVLLALRPRLISARSGPVLPVSLSVPQTDRDAGLLKAPALPESLRSEVTGKVVEGAPLGSWY